MQELHSDKGEKVMKTLTKKALVAYSSSCRLIHAKVQTLALHHANALLFVLGLGLVLGGVAEISSAQSSTFSESDYNDTLVRNSVGNLFRLIEGAFGALVMVVSGLAAIVAAAMGAYRAAVGLLVVAIGAFILRALVSLFFGEDYDNF